MDSFIEQIIYDIINTNLNTNNIDNVLNIFINNIIKHITNWENNTIEHNMNNLLIITNLCNNYENIIKLLKTQIDYIQPINQVSKMFNIALKIIEFNKVLHNYL